MNGILYLNTEMFKDEVLFQKGLGMISSDRREKIGKYKNPLPARLSLGAGVLLRIALERNGLFDKLEEIKTGEYGKPYLEGVDFHFSLSHSGAYVVCAFSDVSVGVDLQVIKETMPIHTRKILSEEERSYLEHLSEENKNEAFYRLWTRKESLIKWDGRGLRLPMHEHSFIENEYISDVLSFEGKALYFKEYDSILSGYAICLCNENNIFPKEMEEINSRILTKY